MSLLVYKSSAGSGKTTTLVNEYLKLCLRKPELYRKVLAITFTNKAANEMKERVIGALQYLSQGIVGEKDEFDSLYTDLTYTQEEMKLQASKLLAIIIHRYEDFSISTIDAFVHSIIRTFALDVKLPQNFEVVIEDDDIIPDIISDLYQKIGKDDSLTNIMLNYVLSAIEDETSYDPTRKLYEFVQQQLKEDGFAYVKRLEEIGMDDFLVIIKNIQEKQASIKSAIRTAATEALERITNKGLEQSDFAYGKNGIYPYFVKTALLKEDKHLGGNKNIAKTINEDKWSAAKASLTAKAGIESLKSDVLTAYEHIQALTPHYFLFKLLYQKIYAVALTKEIAGLFDAYTERSQKVHISEFNKRISDEIADQPVPFIYERLGRKYSHFLIDEFQDTSVLQWNNLLPLIEESLSVGSFNMLVGDAKQAIYRFRNGEVSLFTQLPKLYQNDGSVLSQTREQILTEHYKAVTLDFNYRSMSEITGFNNRFFEFAKGQNSGLQSIYKEHQQKIPDKAEKQGGLVSVNFIEAETAEIYAEKRLAFIDEHIETLFNAGYHQGDICILSRRNKNTREVAAYLLSKGYKVVSSESLLLSNSAHVRLIVDFLSLIIQPEEKILQASFVQNLIFTEIIKGPFHHAFKSIERDSGESDFFNFSGYYNLVQGLTVYEMVEFAIRYLLRTHEPNIYLQFFLDLVNEYQQMANANLEGFLQRWEEKKSKLFISMPKGEDAIQLMTVHKAKGLKFEAVIVDVSLSDFRHGKSTFWTDIHNETIDNLSVSMLPLSRELEHVNLESVYQEEADKSHIDFINMVYVAFTRPVSNLAILGHLGGRRKDQYASLLADFVKSEGLWRDEKLDYCWGKVKLQGKAGSKDNIQTLELTSLPSTAWQKLVELAPSDEVYWEMLGGKAPRTYGKLIHQMLAGIYKAADVDVVLSQTLMSGVIDVNEQESIKSLLQKLITHPQLAQLFAEDALVKNETEIIDDQGKSHRPDRVVYANGILSVIDYKTGDKDEKHRKQIEVYGELFRQLAYERIDLKLVYLDGEIEVVTIDMV